MENRRLFSRLNINFNAEIKDDKNVYSGEIINLSLKGILLKIDDFQGIIDNIYDIKIALAEELIMNFKAKLIHQQNSHYGFKFEAADLDSMIHLRCCLEYNSEQPEQIQEELFFLVDKSN